MRAVKGEAEGDTGGKIDKEQRRQRDCRDA